MKNPVSIMGIMIDDRKRLAPEVQEVLTDYGDHILQRVGIPNHADGSGLITLTLNATEEDLHELKTRLQRIVGVEADYITLRPETTG